MEIANITADLNKSMVRENKKSTENISKEIAVQNEQEVKTEQPKSDFTASELITIAAGGTVTRSIDGDTLELSAEGNNSANASKQSVPKADMAEQTEEPTQSVKTQEELKTEPTQSEETEESKGQEKAKLIK